MTLYPFNNAKGSEISACKAGVAKTPSLSPQLRSALEANCAHPNPAALKSVIGKDCQATAGSTQGIPAAVKNSLATACSQGGSAASAKSAAAQACQQIVKSTVPAALQKKALASCPKS